MPFDWWRLYPDSAVVRVGDLPSSASATRVATTASSRSPVPPSRWLLGLERSIPSQWSVLLQQLETWDRKEKPAWPVVGWTNWRTPRRPEGLPGSDLFSFGTVTPRPGTVPRAVSDWTQLGWNAYVVWYEH